MQENINFTISRHGINVRFHRELAHQEQSQKILNDASVGSFHHDGQYHQSNYGHLPPSKQSTMATFPYQVASVDQEDKGKQKSYKILQVRYDGNKNIFKNNEKQSHHYETESEYFGDSEQNISSESYLSRSQPLVETSSDYEADIDDMESNSHEWEKKCLNLLQLLLKKKKNLEKQKTKTAYKESVESYTTDYHSQLQLPAEYKGKSSQDSQCQTILREKLTTQSEGQMINVNGNSEVALHNSENNKEKQTRKKRQTDTSHQFSLLMSMLNEADEENEATRKCKRCWNEGLHKKHHYPRSRNENIYVNGKYDNQFGGISPLNQIPDPAWHLYHNHNTFVKPTSYKLNIQNPLPFSIKHKILRVPKKKYHVFRQKPWYEPSEYSDLQPDLPIGSREYFAKIKQSLAGQKEKTLFLPHYPIAHHLLPLPHQKLVPTHNYGNPYSFHSFNNEDLRYPTFNSDSYETYDEYTQSVENGEVRDSIGRVYPHQHLTGTVPGSGLNYHVNQMNHKGSHLYNVNHHLPTSMNVNQNYARKDEKSSENRDNTNNFDNNKNFNGFNTDQVPANQDNDMRVKVMKKADELSMDKVTAAPPSHQKLYFDHKFNNDKYLHLPITPIKPNYNQPFDGTKEVAPSKHSPAENNNAWVHSHANILNPVNLREIYETLPTNYEFSAGQWVHIKPAIPPLSLQSSQIHPDQITPNNDPHNVDLSPNKYSVSQANGRSNLKGEIPTYTSQFSEISADKQDGNKLVNATNFQHYLRNYEVGQPTMIHDEKEYNANTSSTNKTLIKIKQMNAEPYQREENHSELIQENGQSPKHFSVQQANNQYGQWTNQLSLHSNVTNENTTPGTHIKTTEFYNTLIHPNFTETPTRLLPSTIAYQTPFTSLAKMQSLHKSQGLHQGKFSSFNKTSYNTDNDLQDVTPRNTQVAVHPDVSPHKNNVYNTGKKNHDERTLPLTMKQQTYTTPLELSLINKIQLRSNEAETFKQNIQEPFLPSAPNTMFAEANQELLNTQGNQITVVPTLQFPHNKFYTYNTAPATPDASKLYYTQTESWLTHHSTQLGSSTKNNNNERMKLTQPTITTTTDSTEDIPTKSTTHNTETRSLQNDPQVFHSKTEIPIAQDVTPASTPEVIQGKEKFGHQEQKNLVEPLFEESKSDESSTTTLVPENRSGDSKETIDNSLTHSTPVTFQLTTEYKTRTPEIVTGPLQATTSDESSKTTSIPTFKNTPHLNDQERHDDSNAVTEENKSTTTQKENKGTMTPSSVNLSKSDQPTILSSVDIHTKDFEHATSEPTPFPTTSTEIIIKDLKTTADNFPVSVKHSTNPNQEYFTEKTKSSSTTQDSTKNRASIKVDHPTDQINTSLWQNQILNSQLTEPNIYDEESQVGKTKDLSGENTDFFTNTTVEKNYKPSGVTVKYESLSKTNGNDINISSMDTNHSGPIFNLFEANISHKSIPSREGTSVVILHNNTRYLSDSQFQESSPSIYETLDDISKIPSTPRSITSYTVTRENNSLGTMSMTTIFPPSSSLESNQHATDKTDSFIERFALDHTQGNTVTTPQPEPKAIYGLAQPFHQIQDNKKYYRGDDSTSQGDKDYEDDYENVNDEYTDPPEKNDKSEVSFSLDQSQNTQSEYNTSSNEDFTFSSYSGSSSQRAFGMNDLPEYSGSILILNPMNGKVTHNIPVTGKLLPYLSHYSTFPSAHTYGNTNSWISNAVLSQRTEEFLNPQFPQVKNLREQVASNSQSTQLDATEHNSFKTPIISYTGRNEENTTFRTNISGAQNQSDIVPLKDILTQSNYFTPSSTENSSEAFNPNYIVAKSPEEKSALRESSVLTAIYKPTESSKRILIPTHQPSLLTSIQKNSTCESAYKQYIYKYFLRVLLSQYLEEIKNNDNNQCTEFCIGGKLPSVCDECIKQLLQDQKRDEQDFVERIKLYNSQHCMQNYNGTEPYLEDIHPCAVYSNCKLGVISNILEKIGQWLRNI